MSDQEIDMSGLAVQTPEGALIARITVFENQELASEATGKSCTSIADQLRVIKGLSTYVPDLSTVAGDKEARQNRALCVACRTGAKKTWDLASAPLKAVASAGLRMVKDIEQTVREIEEPIDAAIKIEEDRKEQEKLAKQQAEAERVRKINDLVSVFRGWFAAMIGRTSAEIQDKIARCEKSVINEEVFMEFTRGAQLAKSASIAQLQQLLASTLEQETRTRELETAKAEQDARDKEIQELRAQLAAAGIQQAPKVISVEAAASAIEAVCDEIEQRFGASADEAISGQPDDDTWSNEEEFVAARDKIQEAAALFEDEPTVPELTADDAALDKVLSEIDSSTEDDSTAELMSAVEDAMAYHNTVVEILAAAQNTQAFPNHMKFRAFVVTKCKEVLEG